MKKFFNNKILYTLIFFVCILLSYFLTNSVFADYDESITFHSDVVDDDITIVMPDYLPSEYDKFLFIVTPSSDGKLFTYNFVFSISDVLCASSEKPEGVLLASSLTSSDDNPFYYYSSNTRFLYPNDGFSKNRIDFTTSKMKEWFNNSHSLSTGLTTGIFVNNYEVCYANYDVHDIYTGNLLFQGAPAVEQVIIPEIQSVEEIPQAMGEVLKILIPIGLIIFGIGLLIYLVQSLTSRVT